MQLFLDILIAIAVFLLVSVAALRRGAKYHVTGISVFYVLLALALGGIITYRSVLHERYQLLHNERIRLQTERQIQLLKDTYGLTLSRDSTAWVISDSAKYRSH